MLIGVRRSHGLGSYISHKANWAVGWSTDNPSVDDCGKLAELLGYLALPRWGDTPRDTPHILVSTFFVYE